MAESFAASLATQGTLDPAGLFTFDCLFQVVSRHRFLVHMERLSLVSRAALTWATVTLTREPFEVSNLKKN